MSDVMSLAEKLIDKAKTVVVASLDARGNPDMRAMLAPRHREGLAQFWLTTNTSSSKVAEFEANPNAALYFFDEFHFTGLTLYGTMETLRDEASRKLIWKTGDRMFYKEGVNDPDYTVLRFTATRGRFYKSQHVTVFEVS
ncbi:MAG: pyridoxamine 5'-phosphate oxidase family protein [Propionibacteriaceae bacterium]|jgi:general stress protein 26|nr:pyridoxamine 5'-phosphate oxidase family protein [Propionibacteriaceae bacterium]